MSILFDLNLGTKPSTPQAMYFPRWNQSFQVVWRQVGTR